MKNLLSILAFVMLGVLMQAQSFQLSNATELLGAGGIKKIEGDHAFTATGVFQGSDLMVNSPPSQGGAVTTNGSVLAIASDATVHLFGTGNTWEQIPNVFGSKNITTFGESAMVHTINGGIYYGPSNGALLPNSFTNIGINPIIGVWGQAFPLKKVQKLGENQFMTFHEGSSREVVVGSFNSNGALSMNVIQTQHHHDDVIDSDTESGKVLYVATTTPVGTSLMMDRFISIDLTGNQIVHAELAGGINHMATHDENKVIFTSSVPISIVPRGGTPLDGIQQNGSNFVLYDKITGELVSLATVYYAEMADVIVSGDSIFLAINPAGAAALVYCGSDTIWCNGPTILAFVPAISTGLFQLSPQDCFSIANNGGSNPIITAKTSGKLTLTDLAGKTLKSVDLRVGETVSLNDLTSGVYLATFHGEYGITTRKVVKD